VKLRSTLLQFIGGCIGIRQSFLDGAKAAFKAQVFGPIGRTHAPPAYQFDDLVPFS
jgi:hypothetical protein